MGELSPEQKRILEKLEASDKYGSLEPNSVSVDQDFVRPKDAVAFPAKPMKTV